MFPWEISVGLGGFSSVSAMSEASGAGGET